MRKASIAPSRQYNDDMDLRFLKKICARECGLTLKQPVMVGVSGGADSLALADGLSALGYQVIVAHFDHQLRSESQADLVFVREFSEQRKFKFIAGNGDVKAFAREKGLSTEEAARQMRYAFLFDAARKYTAQALAVGHTADDQVETVLMHLLRGAGLDGLKGMPWRGILEVFDPLIPLVRPLLGTWRTETEDWCRAHDLAYRVDATNQDTSYARNRLRLEIIPLLDSVNPQARAHIHRTAAQLAGDQRVLNQLTEEAFEVCLESQGEGYLAFKRVALVDLDPALQARVVRLAAVRLVKVLRDFDAGAVEQCLDAISLVPVGWQADLPGGLRVMVADERLYLMTWQADLPGQDWPQAPAEFRERLAIPGKVILENGWELQAEAVRDPQSALTSARTNEDLNQAWLDIGSDAAELVVKRAAPGQRFKPLGMDTGSQKLSDFWVNEHLPKPARAGWPVVYLGEEPAWLPGFRLAEPFKLNASSRKIVRLNLIRKES